MLWFCNKFFIKAFLPYALPPPLFLPVLSPSLFYHYLSLTLSHSILLTPSLPSQFDMDILLLIPLVPHSNLSILSLYPSFPLQSQLPPPRTPSATFTSFHLLFAFIPFLLSKAKSNLFHTPTFPTRSFSLSIQLFILYHTPTLSPSTRFISHPPALNIRNIAVILSGF